MSVVVLFRPPFSLFLEGENRIAAHAMGEGLSEAGVEAVEAGVELGCVGHGVSEIVVRLSWCFRDWPTGNRLAE